jgi:hypothetical protein
MQIFARRTLLAASAGLVVAGGVGAHRLLQAPENASIQADPVAPLRRLVQDRGGDRAGWLDDRGLLAAVNAAYHADGTGLPQTLAAALDLGDAKLLQWLVWTFDSRDLFNPQGPPLTPVDHDALHTANRIVLSPILDPHPLAAPTAQPPTLQAEDRAWTLDQKLRALDNPVRDGQLRPELILPELGVRPGMVVADIGAGEGLLSLPMARAVTPDGTVHALDVDPRMVELLKKRAADQHLERLKPVLVQPGLDHFYTRESFDLAVLCTVYEYLDAPVAFLRHVRAALVPRKGKLALLQGKVSTPFFASDFGIGFRHDRLRQLGARVPPDLQAAVDRIGKGDIADAALRERLAELFNELARDPALPATLPLPDAGDDAKLLTWLSAHRGKGPTPAIQAAALLTEVQIRLRSFFANGLNREVFPRGIYLGERRLVRALALAGYRLERRVDGLPAHDFWIFAPTD